MKAPQRSIILPLLLLSSLVARAETPAELANRAAEQERQIRQLEVQNQRLRDQIERLEERLAAYEDKAPEASSADTAAPATESGLPPIAEEPSSTTPQPVEEGPVHVVRAGESLSTIARRHGTTTEALAELNGISNPSLIREGQRLKLPGNAEAPAPAEAAALSGTHTVKAGETFYSIARLYGLGVEALQAANPGVNPKALQVGQELKLAPKEAEETEQPAETDLPAEPETSALPSDKPVIRSIPIDENISFGEFAKQHNMDTAKLNALNGLQLEPKTVLATGSRLYVSAQPLE